MTLTTHAVVGAAVASLIPLHPALGLCAAFVSHFAIDAIPHWDYPIASKSIDPNLGGPMKYDSASLVDSARIGTDILLGLLFSILAFSSVAGLQIVILGALAGILPDPLQFAYLHFQHEPMVSLQRFHTWIHTNNHLEDKKVMGISSQVLFIVFIIATRRLIA